MSSFEQNIENILFHLEGRYMSDTETRTNAELRAEAKAALIQAHQDDLQAVIGEDERVAYGVDYSGPLEPIESYHRNHLRHKQRERAHLTQETKQ
jgi:hypothetical protein